MALLRRGLHVAQQFRYKSLLAKVWKSLVCPQRALLWSVCSSAVGSAERIWLSSGAALLAMLYRSKSRYGDRGIPCWKLKICTTADAIMLTALC